MIQVRSVLGVGVVTWEGGEEISKTKLLDGWLLENRRRKGHNYSQIELLCSKIHPTPIKVKRRMIPNAAYVWTC